MDFKFFSTIINTKKKANIFNIVSAILFWGGAGLLIYFFYWIKNVEIFGSYFFYLILGIITLLFVYKLIVLKFYKRRFIPIFFIVVVPFILYCIFFIFILLWNSASFIGPTILWEIWILILSKTEKLTRKVLLNLIFLFQFFFGCC